MGNRNLEAAAVAKYTSELKAILSGTPADGAAVVTALSAFDATKVNSRLEQVLTNAKSTVYLSSTELQLLEDALSLVS